MTFLFSGIQKFVSHCDTLNKRVIIMNNKIIKNAEREAREIIKKAKQEAKEIKKIAKDEAKVIKKLAQTESKDIKKKKKAAVKEKTKKIRFLHTRVSVDLERKVKRRAEEEKIPVSNLIRNILEDSFK